MRAWSVIGLHTTGSGVADIVDSSGWEKSQVLRTTGKTAAKERHLPTMDPTFLPNGPRMWGRFSFQLSDDGAVRPRRSERRHDAVEDPILTIEFALHDNHAGSATEHG